MSRDDERSTGALLSKRTMTTQSVVTSLSSNFTHERAGCHSPCEKDFFRLNELNGKVKVTFDLALNLHLAKRKKSDDDA